MPVTGLSPGGGRGYIIIVIVAGDNTYKRHTAISLTAVVAVITGQSSEPLLQVNTH